MSTDSIDKFMTFLNTHPKAKEEALALKKLYPNQEHLLEAFIKYAEKSGFKFSAAEYAAYVLKNAKQ